jgi:hypothetical protein
MLNCGKGVYQSRQVSYTSIRDRYKIYVMHLKVKILLTKGPPLLKKLTGDTIIDHILLLK